MTEADTTVEADATPEDFKFFDYNDDLARRGWGGYGVPQIWGGDGAWHLITYAVDTFTAFEPIPEERAVEMIGGDAEALQGPMVPVAEAKTKEAAPDAPDTAA